MKWQQQCSRLNALSTWSFRTSMIATSPWTFQFSLNITMQCIKLLIKLLRITCYIEYLVFLHYESLSSCRCLWKHFNACIFSKYCLLCRIESLPENVYRDKFFESHFQQQWRAVRCSCIPREYAHCVCSLYNIHYVSSFASATWIGRCIQYAVLAIQIIWAILILSHFVSFPHVLRLSVAIFLFSLDLFSQFFVVNELRWRMSYVYDNLKRSPFLLPEPHELKHRRKKEKFMKSHLMPHDEFQLFIENVLIVDSSSPCKCFMVAIKIAVDCTYSGPSTLNGSQMRFESDGEKNRSNFLLKQ